MLRQLLPTKKHCAGTAARRAALLLHHSRNRRTPMSCSDAGKEYTIQGQPSSWAIPPLIKEIQQVKHIHDAVAIEVSRT
jgi:hypothetical protein